MNEFLKLNWRLTDLTALKTPQESFISEDAIVTSCVHKYLQDRGLLCSRKQRSNIFQQSPFVPGGPKAETFVKSTLDTWAHEQCLNALKLFQSGKNPSSYTATEKFSVEIFSKLKSRIIKENSVYQSYVFERWQKRDKTKLASINKGLVSYGREKWEAKWKNITLYPQFYNEICTINMTFNEDESIIDFKCISNALELGTLARFSLPILTSRCTLDYDALPSLQESKCVYSNLPVSQDQNVTKILEKHHDLNLVISASSIKCITDTSDPKRKWMIPVVIKSITLLKEDGSTIKKNVVFLDKPCSSDVSYKDFAYASYKRLIKTNFCRFEAFRYEDKESPPLEENKSSLEYGNYSFGGPQNISNKTIHRNASYKIWNIKKAHCQNNLMKSIHKPVEFNVLIRSKLDACECNAESALLNPVIIRPKLEMQPKCGANVPSKSELAREWTSLFFTPFSTLYRVRLSIYNGEVICVEKCNIQKVVAEANAYYDYKPQLGLGILQTVFEALIPLETGNYLLQHLPKHEAFLAVLKESKQSMDKQGDNFDLHSECNKVAVSELPSNWLPIDVNFILPSFDAAKCMPGMFTPRTDEKYKKSKRKVKKKCTQTKQ